MLPASDTTLLALAKQLDTSVQFESVTPEMEQTVLDLARQRDTPWKNVTLSPNGQIFRVKVFVRSAEFRIGLTKDFLKALRFADMATLYFWKYRRRKVDCLGDAYFNFRMADAQQDVDGEAVAMMLILEIEKYLVKSNPAWLEPKAKKVKLTQQSLLRDELKEIQDKLDYIISLVVSPGIKAASLGSIPPRTLVESPTDILPPWPFPGKDQVCPKDPDSEAACAMRAVEKLFSPTPLPKP